MWVPLKVFHQKRSQRASFPLGSFILTYSVTSRLRVSTRRLNTPQLFVGPSGSFWVCRTLIFPGETRKQQPKPAEAPGVGGSGNHNTTLVTKTLISETKHLFRVAVLNAATA